MSFWIDMGNDVRSVGFDTVTKRRCATCGHVFISNAAKKFRCCDQPVRVDGPQMDETRPPQPIRFPAFQYGSQSGGLAVVTVACGCRSKTLARFTVPQMERYANRCGAHMIFMNRNQFIRWPIANKFTVGDIAKRYDRTLFVDVDCWITDECPDMVQAFASGCVWMHCDDPYLSGRDFLDNDARILGRPGFRLKCWNTGVVLLDREHAGIWKAPDGVMETTHTLEQSAVEVNAADAGIAIRELPRAFNHQYWMRCFEDGKGDAHIIHMANAKHEVRIEEFRRLRAETKRHAGSDHSVQTPVNPRPPTSVPS